MLAAAEDVVDHALPDVGDHALGGAVFLGVVLGRFGLLGELEVDAVEAGDLEEGGAGGDPVGVHGDNGDLRGADGSVDDDVDDAVVVRDDGDHGAGVGLGGSGVEGVPGGEDGGAQVAVRPGSGS